MNLSALNICLIQNDVNNDGWAFSGVAALYGAPGRYERARRKGEGIRSAVKRAGGDFVNPGIKRGKDSHWLSVEHQIAKKEQSQT